MKDEIKETITRMASYTIHYDCCSEGDAEKDIDKLLDYIINLQEENERLKEIHKLNELICEIAKYDTNQIKITRKKMEECLFTIRQVEEMKNWLKESELDEQIKNDN